MKPPAGTSDLLDIWGAGSQDVYAVGKASTLLNYNGKSWTKISLANSSASEDFTGVWMDNTGKSPLVYISTTAGKIRTYSRTTNKWAVAHSVSNALYGIHGSGLNVQAVGANGTLATNWDGTWKAAGVTLSESMYGAWTLASGEYYLVGDDARGVRYYKAPFGSWRWVPMPTPSTKCDLRAAWGAAASKVYVVGLKGCTLGYANTSSAMSFFTFTLNIKGDWYDIWGDNKGQIFVVGHNPAKPAAAPIRRYDGSKWVSHSVSVSGVSPATLRGIWGTGNGKLFAVGHGGLILQN